MLKIVFDRYIDKANGNVFICKHLYIKVLIKQLGIGPDGTSQNCNTYNIYDINNHVTINQHPKYLQ